MSKTNDLRKLIYTKLNGLKTAYPAIKNVYYRVADKGSVYPHIVFDFESVQMNNLTRDDYMLSIDLFDNDTKRSEDIADSIEELLKTKNLPQNTILPTFYLDSRRNLPDEDINVRHILIRFEIQNYER